MSLYDIILACMGQIAGVEERRKYAINKTHDSARKILL